MPKGVYKKKKVPPEERFWPKVLKTESCWIWNAWKTAQGYGQFWHGSGYTTAHRWSYENSKGKIPEKMVIDHLCRNPSCVNPEHLEVVTMAENTRRGELFVKLKHRASSLTHCKRGHPLSGENLTKTSTPIKRTCKRCMMDKAKEWRKKNWENVKQQQRMRRRQGKN